ncbi:glycosyltransferase family 4 protein [Algoriphagus sp.]|uniref:glycosyltransferase family 4 protein n=1 Tax=Algoriphagus sp. TaxID=1872435 RepID=UPI00327A3014
MTVRKHRVLFILPELNSPGGMELENLGFISALQEQDQFEVLVINLASNPHYFPSLNFQIARPSLGQTLQLFFHLRFIKIFIKFKGKLKESLMNVFLNFPDLLSSFLSEQIQKSDVCFASVRPGNFLGYIHELTEKKQKVFVYHEISKFNTKYLPFFQKLNQYGIHFISAIEKKEYLQANFPDSTFLEIKQWIYHSQNEFLSIPIPDGRQQVFGAITRLDYGKNLDLIFSALVVLKGEGLEPTLRLFGDGPELPRLRELVNSLGISKQVEFLGGFGFDERVEVYRKIDILLIPSLFEGGPITLLEAMAASRPVISTNVGDVRNRISPDYNGVILDSMKDPGELATAMRFYLDHPEEISSQGMNSRTKYLAEFEEKQGKKIFVNAMKKVSLAFSSF